MLNKPILFITFNRPDITARVFEAVRTAQPKQLFITCDGPRDGNNDDIEKVTKVKKIITKIDWPCETMTLFREKNLGCEKAVSSAIDWFFKHVEQGIILEDDCLPSPSFFSYCEELLKYYDNDERIMHISGDNFQRGKRRSADSYYFSVYPHVWGWATWRRAWKKFDFSMSSWPDFHKTRQLDKIFSKKSAVNYWKNILQMTYNNQMNSWAFRWAFSCWNNNGLSIIPNTNLISNIGFDKEGTHTRSQNNILADLPRADIKIPLTHPTAIEANRAADIYTQVNHFQPSLIKKLLTRILK